MSGLRVLLTADAVGGVWQYATDLARALVPLGVEPVLALLGPAPSAAQRADAADLRLIETGLPLDWLAQTQAQVIAAGRAIADLARLERADLVQLNAPALGAGGDFTVPVIAVSHSCLPSWWAAVIDGPVPDDFRWRGALHGEGLRRADLVVTPSRAFAQATQRAHRLDRLPTAIHNGRAPLDLPEVAVAGASFAFTAGRLWDRGKDVATLDRAAASLGMPLLAAGPTRGPNGEQVTLAHARGLGMLDEAGLARCLGQRPVFASAALYEPFGLAVLEAAQAGCPLVLADIPTFRELWDGAALFVPAGDAEGFAAAITLAAENASALGAKARERAGRYTVDAIAGATLAAYTAIAPLPEVREGRAVAA